MTHKWQIFPSSSLCRQLQLKCEYAVEIVDHLFEVDSHWEKKQKYLRINYGLNVTQWADTI